MSIRRNRKLPEDIVAAQAAHANTCNDSRSRSTDTRSFYSKFIEREVSDMAKAKAIIKQKICYPQRAHANICNDSQSLSAVELSFCTGLLERGTRGMTKAILDQTCFQPGGICDLRKFAKSVWKNQPYPNIDETMTNKALEDEKDETIGGNIAPYSLWCARRLPDEKSLFNKISDDFLLSISASSQNHVSKLCTFIPTAALIVKYQQQLNDHAKLDLYNELTNSELDEKCSLFTKDINQAILYSTTHEKEQLPQDVQTFAKKFNLNLCTDADNQLEKFQNLIQDHFDPSELAIFVRSDICKLTRTFLALLKNLKGSNKLVDEVLENISLFTGNCTSKEKIVCKHALGYTIKRDLPPIIHFLLQFTTGGWITHEGKHMWSYHKKPNTYNKVMELCSSLTKSRRKSASTTPSPIQSRRKRRESMTPSSSPNTLPTKISKTTPTTADTPVIEKTFAVPPQPVKAIPAKSLFDPVPNSKLDSGKLSSSQDSEATFKQSLDEDIKMSSQDSREDDYGWKPYQSVEDFEYYALSYGLEPHPLDSMPSSQDSTKMVSPKTRGQPFQTLSQNSLYSPREYESRSSQSNDE